MSPATNASSSDDAILCRLKWELASSHAWGGSIPTDDLLYVLDSADQGRGRELAEKLKPKPYVTWQRGRGYGVKNSPNEQAKLAVELRDGCGYLEIQIEAKLSRFEQAGGFDAYG